MSAESDTIETYTLETLPSSMPDRFRIREPHSTWKRYSRGHNLSIGKSHPGKSSEVVGRDSWSLRISPLNAGEDARRQLIEVALCRECPLMSYRALRSLGATFKDLLPSPLASFVHNPLGSITLRGTYVSRRLRSETPVRSLEDLHLDQDFINESKQLLFLSEGVPPGIPGVQVLGDYSWIDLSHYNSRLLCQWLHTDTGLTQAQQSALIQVLLNIPDSGFPLGHPLRALHKRSPEDLSLSNIALLGPGNLKIPEEAEYVVYSSRTFDSGPKLLEADSFESESPRGVLIATSDINSDLGGGRIGIPFEPTDKLLVFNPMGLNTMWIDLRSSWIDLPESWRDLLGSSGSTFHINKWSLVGDSKLTFSGESYSISGEGYHISTPPPIDAPAFERSIILEVQGVLSEYVPQYASGSQKNKTTEMLECDSKMLVPKIEDRSDAVPEKKKPIISSGFLGTMFLMALASGAPTLNQKGGRFSRVTTAKGQMKQ